MSAVPASPARGRPRPARDAPGRPGLDARLLAGMAVTVATLAAVFEDHWPGGTGSCPACGHQAAGRERECPSLATARALLARRRFEHPGQVPERVRAELRRRATRRGRARRSANVGAPPRRDTIIPSQMGGTP